LYGNDIYGLGLVIDKITDKRSINNSENVIKNKRVYKNKNYIYEYYKLLFYILTMGSNI
jgi:hypothetical protein